MATSASNAIKRSILTMVCTVYQRTANTGPFNHPVKTGLACRLDILSALSPIRTSAERADIAAHRTFYWDVDYALPEQGTQIEITNIPIYAGQRWNVVSGTARPSIPMGATEPIEIEIDVRRAN